MKKIFSMNRFEGWNLSLPLIQGGMGVGVSLSGLAGAVASEGGMGVISTAQIGFEEPDFVGNEEACNLRSIRKHIVRAKELASGKGMIAVNVMVALQQYREHHCSLLRYCLLRCCYRLLCFHILQTWMLPLLHIILC